MGFLYFLIIGALAGWLAGKIMKARGFGLLGNIVGGIGVGGAVGGDEIHGAAMSVGYLKIRPAQGIRYRSLHPGPRSARPVHRDLQPRRCPERCADRAAEFRGEQSPGPAVAAGNQCTLL